MSEIHLPNDFLANKLACRNLKVSVTSLRWLFLVFWLFSDFSLLGVFCIMIFPIKTW